MQNYFYPLVENPYRYKDLKKAKKILDSGKLTSGPVTEKFQNSF